MEYNIKTFNSDNISENFYDLYKRAPYWAYIFAINNKYIPDIQKINLQEDLENQVFPINYKKKFIDKFLKNTFGLLVVNFLYTELSISFLPLIKNTQLYITTTHSLTDIDINRLGELGFYIIKNNPFILKYSKKLANY
jgi:hypothetical protein